MNDDIKRLSRLTAIITLIQTKRLITSSELAAKFSVTKRTIYRDIKALEQAGVPIITEEGKGYILMEGYKIPPVMFTENEANALITAEKLVQKNSDKSFIAEYNNAINKIKAVLRYDTKDKVNLLDNRIAYIKDKNRNDSNLLSVLQLAITDFKIVEIEYISLEKGEKTKRIVEPFALYNTQENWVLVAYCTLRKDFRAFRLEQIERIQIFEEIFKPHQITLQQYFEDCKK